MKNKLGILFLLIAVIAVISIFRFLNSNALHKEDVGTTAPTVALTKESLTNFFTKNNWIDYAKNEVKLSPDVFNNSQTVYIHLWASWCAPCVNEVPELIEFAQKNTDKVKFIAISLDDNIDDLSKFLISFPEFNGNRFIKIFDQDKKASQFINADRLPMTIKISGDQVKEIRSVINWKSLVAE